MPDVPGEITGHSDYGPGHSGPGHSGPCHNGPRHPNHDPVAIADFVNRHEEQIRRHIRNSLRRRGAAGRIKTSRHGTGTSDVRSIFNSGLLNLLGHAGAPLSLSYFRAVVDNVMNERSRREARERSVFCDVDCAQAVECDADAEYKTMVDEEQQRLLSHVQHTMKTELTDQARSDVQDRYLSEKSFEDIALLRRTTPKVVRSVVSKAIHKLRVLVKNTSAHSDT